MAIKTSMDIQEEKLENKKVHESSSVEQQNHDVNLNGVRSGFGHYEEPKVKGIQSLLGDFICSENSIEANSIAERISAYCAQAKSTYSKTKIGSYHFGVKIVDKAVYGIPYTSVIITAEKGNVIKYFDIVLAWTGVSSVAVAEYFDQSGNIVWVPDDTLSPNDPSTTELHAIKHSVIGSKDKECQKTGHYVATAADTEETIDEIAKIALNSFIGSEYEPLKLKNVMKDSNINYRVNFSQLPLSDKLETWEMELVASTTFRQNMVFSGGGDQSILKISGYIDVMPWNVMTPEGMAVTRFRPLIVVTKLDIKSNHPSTFSLALAVASLMASERLYMYVLTSGGEKDLHRVGVLNKIARLGDTDQPLNFAKCSNQQKAALIDKLTSVSSNNPLSPIVCFDIDCAGKNSYLTHSILSANFINEVSEFLDAPLHNAPIQSAAILPTGTFIPNGGKIPVDIRKISFIDACDDKFKDISLYYESCNGVNAYRTRMAFLNMYVHDARITGKYQRCYMSIDFLKEFTELLIANGFGAKFNFTPFPKSNGGLDFNYNFGQGQYTTGLGIGQQQVGFRTFGF